MRTHSITLIAAAVCALLALTTGCGSGSVGRNGEVVGGPCTGGSGCASGSVCETASMYPGGMCSLTCSSQSACPSGTRCVTEGGGRCLLACSSASDCRDGYGCNRKSLVGGSEALVCIR